MVSAVDIFTLVAEVVGVTASGALAPGPLFVKNVTEGTRSGAKSGFAFAVGHTVVEFSLVLVLALGLLTVADQPVVKLVIGLAGGSALLAFGVWQIRESLGSKPIEVGEKRTALKSHLLVGSVFTGLNPYFVLWWIFVGSKLILDSLAFASLAGVLLMYVAHVWIDYAWLTGTAYLARRGIKFVGRKSYRIVLMLFGLILIGFGLYFLVTALV
ncbi:MAG TPA: LysE family transporter [Candidatus Bathyarchaeia archaeon]|nr:LysE family transporter [Candidatus Bathyarchaeia archaeon]